MKHSGMILGVCLAASAQAEVVLDGSLGQSGSLSGPDYRIGAELGRQAGTNLFHSFSTLNLTQQESATFSGPQEITHVIGRITGNAQSSIDGTLRSTIPQADLYLFNPAGMMFGPNAKLDVPGSFYAGAADNLKFDDGTEFSAYAAETSQLSIAAPTEFGFLPDAALSVESMHSAGFNVDSGKTLGLAGGEVRIENSLLSITGAKLRIDAGHVILNSSIVDAESQTEGSAGTIEINADDLKLSGGSWLSSFARGDSNGGDITLNITGDIHLSGENSGKLPTRIRAGSEDGKSGRIDIHANNLTLEDGAWIIATSSGKGAGGDISITTEESVELIGESAAGTVSGLFAFSASTEADAGDAGTIEVNTGILSLQNGARINGDTWGGGQGGKITLHAHERIELFGEQRLSDGSSSIISASARGDYASAQGGTLEISAPRIELRDGAQIGTSTFGAAQGGAISIQADTLSVSGQNQNQKPSAILSDSALDSEESTSDLEQEVTGNAGSLIINADTIEISHGAALYAKTDSQGMGGNLEIHGGTLTLQDNGRISSESKGQGEAGVIRIYLDGPLRMENSSIQTATLGADGGDLEIFSPTYLDLRDSEISTSVYDSAEVKAGNGGNIHLEPEFILLQGSRIFARAIEGNGGNIGITTSGIFPNYNIAGTISASSEFGLDGVIDINAPDIDMASTLALPTEFLNAAALRQSPCSVREARDSSRFVYIYKGSGQLPEDLRGGSLSTPVGEPQ